VAVNASSLQQEKVFFVNKITSATKYALLHARQEDIKDLSGTEADIVYLAIGKWR
jgi:hypothetical protein